VSPGSADVDLIALPLDRDQVVLEIDRDGKRHTVKVSIRGAEQRVEFD
jgi:hypothetical protein